MSIRRDPDLNTYSGRFALRVRTLREACGLTAKEVAEQMGISVRTYYGWEAGERDISIDYIPMLAKCFKVAIRDLMPTK